MKRSIDSWRAVPRALTLKVWRCRYPNALMDTHTEKDQQIITLIGQGGEAGFDLPLEAYGHPSGYQPLTKLTGEGGQT